jgi:hypothetical protein
LDQGSTKATAQPYFKLTWPGTASVYRHWHIENWNTNSLTKIGQKIKPTFNRMTHAVKTPLSKLAATALSGYSSTSQLNQQPQGSTKALQI